MSSELSASHLCCNTQTPRLHSVARRVLSPQYFKKAQLHLHGLYFGHPVKDAYFCCWQNYRVLPTGSAKLVVPDDIAAEFAALEELKRTEDVQCINEVEVLEGNAFDFDELDRIEQGIIPQTVLDEVEVVNYNGEGDGWDEAALMSSFGMSYT
ncbi:hypothetical protein DFJ58DRAFT_848156 [Suillus subalutaceus]|uniref:uncharacterized protein n=1 Tax=Suillus subalutaceus TaxID=48586 RepID=UPI001B87304D|nr:uncharacterized protein DFJ58DRAFT_848156 [Suillus subalutaceus]KAG1831690.1 hypothetical protein DFJ58DRAFT_848156 [Suillus subalutaceus]